MTVPDQALFGPTGADQELFKLIDDLERAGKPIQYFRSMPVEVTLNKFDSAVLVLSNDEFRSRVAHAAGFLASKMNTDRVCVLVTRATTAFEELPVKQVILEDINQTKDELLQILARPKVEERTSHYGPTTSADTGLGKAVLPAAIQPGPASSRVIGAFERLTDTARSLLDSDAWDDPTIANHVEEITRHLQHQLYRAPNGQANLAVLGLLGKQLAELMATLLPPRDKYIVEDITAPQTDDFLDVSHTLVEPVDRLANRAKSAGNVPEGHNRYKWLVEILGGAGSGVTVGIGIAQAVGASPEAAGIVGAVIGVLAALVWYVGHSDDFPETE